MVFVGIGIVMEVDTHSIPMINLTADSSAWIHPRQMPHSRAP
jgi:hypothetical protein